MPFIRRGTVLTVLGSIAGVLACSLVAAKCIRPVPVESPDRLLVRGAVTTPKVAYILQRACQDCHSNSTHWPWYARMAPVSWMVISDVEKGRKFLNLSLWDHYTKGQRLGFLSSISGAAKNRAMPPRGYAFLHPEARLSEGERLELAGWAKDERRRMRAAR